MDRFAVDIQDWKGFDKLTLEDRGKLFTAAYNLAVSGERSEPGGAADVLFDRIAEGIIAQREKQADISQKRKAAVTARWSIDKPKRRSSTVKKKPAQAAQVDGQDVETQVQEPEQETFIQIILNDGTFYPVTLQDVEEFRQYYPAVDVESEIRKVAAWSKNNPTKRKTRGGVRKFINGWLSRAQDKGGSSGDEYMKPQGQQAPMVKPYYESPFKLMWQAELAKEEAEKQNAGS